MDRAAIMNAALNFPARTRLCPGHSETILEPIPMITKTTCATCGQHLELDGELAGQEISCPNCGTKTVLQNPPAPVIRIPKSAKLNPSQREPGTSPVIPVAAKIIANIEKVIVDKRREIEL